MNIPRKYWWVIAIVIPILVAVVGIIPQLISKDEPSKPFYVEVVGTQFNGQVAFNREWEWGQVLGMGSGLDFIH